MHPYPNHIPTPKKTKAKTQKTTAKLWKSLLWNCHEELGGKTISLPITVLNDVLAALLFPATAVSLYFLHSTDFSVCFSFLCNCKQIEILPRLCLPTVLLFRINTFPLIQMLKWGMMMWTSELGLSSRLQFLLQYV